jgi:hypothetical protein
MTIVTPPAPVKPEWVTAADVAAQLGVSESQVLEVLPARWGRVAQLPDGSQRQEIDPARVHQVAASLGLPKE